MDKKNQTIYPYQDEQGNLLYRKIRIENNGSKSFYYEREENGTIVKNIDGCRKPLYRFPHILMAIKNSKPIFLVEGEKDADNLLKYLLIASTAPVTLKWSDEYTQTLKDADIVILYDNDKAGLQRRDLIAQNLYGKVRRLRIIDLPGIEYSESHGKDISDWLEMGNSIDQLKELVEKTPDYTPHVELQPIKQKDALKVISIDELLALQLPAREMLLYPFLPSQGLVMIAAKRGVGKTHVALGIAYAIASGGAFLRWTAPIPRKVLYIDGEMPAVSMQERVSMIAKMTDKRPESNFLRFITPDLQEQTMPNLSLEDGRIKIEKDVADCDLVIIDNISCLFRSGCENDAESWQEAQEWALELRRKGKSVLFVHHMGKNGTQRGTSKKEDILDAVVILKHSDDYQASEGARFEIHFDKARHFSGDNARSFQARLVKEEGKERWVILNDPEEEQIAQIAQMKNTGYTINSIMTETKLTKSQVETLLKKAKSRGIL